MLGSELRDQMVTLEDLTGRIRTAIASGEALDRSIKLDLRGQGFIHLEGARVSNDDDPADLVVSVTRADLVAMGKGDLDPMRAVMTGRMRLSDFALALSLQPRLQRLFEQAV